MSFGDIRVAGRADWLIERVAATGSLVLRQLGETRAGEMLALKSLATLTRLCMRVAWAFRERRVSRSNKAPTD